MEKGTVKRRIFISNAWMVLVTLVLFLGINIFVIFCYSESIEKEFEKKIEKVVDPDQIDDMVKDYTIYRDVRILTNSWKVYKGDREIKFPNREFEILKFMAMNPNIVFSKEQIFEKIWGYDYMGDSATVMVHINRIREKIEDDSKNPKILETVWGAGYRLNK